MKFDLIVIITNEFDKVYMIDTAGSMEDFINSTKEETLNFSDSLKNFPCRNFNFGLIF